MVRRIKPEDAMALTRFFGYFAAAYGTCWLAVLFAALLSQRLGLETLEGERPDEDRIDEGCDEADLKQRRNGGILS
jgi:hypothetical protein